MDQVQEHFERGVGDRFAEWLARTTGHPCTFLRRAGEAPDLVYAYKDVEIQVEITGSYYDSEHAAMLWQAARGQTEEPGSWIGANPHRALANAVLNLLKKKGAKSYAATSVLLVNVPPGLTRLSALVDALGDDVPSDLPFLAVYVVGVFPRENDLGGEYEVLPLKPLARGN